MHVSVEGLRLLEKVGTRDLRVDPTKALPRLDARRRERLTRFVNEHAPDGVVRSTYWLDARLGIVRSRPNLQLLPHDVFVASEGHALVDVRVGVEVLCSLRDSGPDGNELADKVIDDRVRLWDYMAAELATEEEKEYIDEGMKPSRGFRHDVKRQVFASLYGMRPSTQWGETEAEVARYRDVQNRILARWPGLWLGGTKEQRQARIAQRRPREAGVWLTVACEAERLGCRVVGFHMNEPVIECPNNKDVAEVARLLEEVAYGLLRSSKGKVLPFTPVSK